MQAWLSPAELDAVWTSLVVGGRATLFALPLATACAYALSRGRFFGRGALDAIAHAPMVLPPVVGYGLLLLFGVQGRSAALLDKAFGVRLAFTSAAPRWPPALCAFPLMVRSVRLSLDAVDDGPGDGRPQLGGRGLGSRSSPSRCRWPRRASCRPPWSASPRRSASSGR